MAGSMLLFRGIDPLRRQDRGNGEDAGMRMFKAEFTISVTDDEVEVGSCIVYTEADNEKEAAEKIRAWLLKNIEVWPEDVFEAQDLPGAHLIVK
ncbi:hypothetical protein ACXWTF_13050 [Thiomicrolovo sp. ZZH C-3]